MDAILEIDALALAPTAQRGAYTLKAVHPEVTFLSGRRSVAGQAGAMAANIVETDRDWMSRVYRPSTARDACQQWIDRNPQAVSEDEIAAGLQAVMVALTPGQLSELSKHLSGEAFDLAPVSQNAAAIWATIASLPGCTWFTDTEGGLQRWHVQF
jgi:hypothetical protein